MVGDRHHRQLIEEASQPGPGLDVLAGGELRTTLGRSQRGPCFDLDQGIATSASAVSHNSATCWEPGSWMRSFSSDDVST
ncbi:MAG: hypothetical protein R2746_12690 [Acidimicrobiales bacterium]